MENDEVCFVCYDDAAPMMRPCACRTPVHEACLRSSILKVPSHRDGCPVCRQKYEGIECVERRRWRFDADAMVCAAAYLFVLGITLFFLWIGVTHSMSNLLVVLLVFEMIFVSLLLVIHARVGQRVACCVVWESRIVDVRALPLV